MKFCAVHKCGEIHHAKNLCKAHYRLLLRTNIATVKALGYSVDNCLDPNAPPPPPIDMRTDEEKQQQIITLNNTFETACRGLNDFLRGDNARKFKHA